MAIEDLADWIAQQSAPSRIWFVKRLSANDTQNTGGHQAGPYIPKDLLFRALPSLNKPDAENPRITFDAFIDSHVGHAHQPVTAIWYNNKLRGGTRNEARITNWGGSSSPLLDPDSTGALAVFSFFADGRTESEGLRIWICDHAIEEELFEDRMGVPIQPGESVIWQPTGPQQPGLFAVSRVAVASCRLKPSDMPPAWLTRFPTGREIVDKSIELRPASSATIDELLIKRRDCEFEIFLSIEEAIELDRVKKGYDSIGEFIGHAQSIVQRRKSRAGNSLEFQTHALLREDGFIEGQNFSHKAESEAGKIPDFLFPSGAAYKDGQFPAERLRLLAAKTTARDRWRQVIDEADRIPIKHLLTLQEGVSVKQFAQMEAVGLRLVVPAPLMNAYPEEIRGKLISLETFIGEVRNLAIVQ